MKKSTGIILAVIGIVIVLAVLLFSQYNALVDKQIATEEAKSNIATLLQKRADLIPNLAATVKSYASYEEKTYTAVTEARSKVASANTVGELQSADEELSRALNVWVNAVTEAYPDLKANTQYTALTDELASVENEIKYSRETYNEKAAAYNKATRRFPSNIFAKIFGFEEAQLFTAQSGAETAPDLSSILG